MTRNRSWIENIADLISGRIYNTLLALHNNVRSLTGRLSEQEKKMTENEQIIRNAAQGISDAATQIDEGISALLAKIDATAGIEREDLSEELAMLTGATSKLQNVAGRLTPATSAAPAPVVEDQAPVLGGPIIHEEAAPTPLAGESGPTDAGVPTTVPQPGVPVTEPVVTPLAENATEEAVIPSSGTSTPSPAGESTSSPSDTSEVETPVEPTPEEVTSFDEGTPPVVDPTVAPPIDETIFTEDPAPPTPAPATEVDDDDFE